MKKKRAFFRRGRRNDNERLREPSAFAVFKRLDRCKYSGNQLLAIRASEVPKAARRRAK